MALTGPPAELWVTPPPRREPGTLAALWSALAQSAADLWRAVTLLLLFTPAALTAFPALQYGLGRGAWMTLLRCAVQEDVVVVYRLPCFPRAPVRPGPRRLDDAAAVRRARGCSGCSSCFPCLPCSPCSSVRSGPRRMDSAAAVRAPRLGH
jgi:hypothetical protein